MIILLSWIVLLYIEFILIITSQKIFLHNKQFYTTNYDQTQFFSHKRAVDE